MGGHTTVTASDGYRFKITSRSCHVELYANEYRIYGDSATCFFTDEYGVAQNWADPIIELVEIGEPEPDTTSPLFDLPWDEMLATGKPGDRLQIDRNGQFWLLRPGSDVMVSGLGNRVQ